MHHISIIFLLSIFISNHYILAKRLPVPFVIAPPYLRCNTTNSITITPIKQNQENVDIELIIYGLDDSRQNIIIHSNKSKARKAGSPHSYSFKVDKCSPLAKISINVKGHSEFTNVIPVKPDLAIVHLHTDKQIYKAGENVSIRILPLTNSGFIYQAELELALLNPDGFELMRSVVAATDSFVSTNFVLPIHLFYGEWRIIVRPKGHRDNDLTTETVIQVKEYDLPPFKISIVLTQGQPIEATEVAVEARFFHGSPVTGTLNLYCQSSDHQNHTGRHGNLELVQEQIVNGVWKQNINLSPCFATQTKQSATVIVEIRDRGTGNRGETKAEFDPLAPGFELIPLRPVFNANTKELLFVTQSVDNMGNSSKVEVTFSCLDDHKPSVKKEYSLDNDLISLEIPANWKTRCPVIMVQARRKIGEILSRPKTAMIPLVKASAIEPSWIEIQNPKAVYQLDDKLQIKVPEKEARKLNYLVLCNSQSLAAVGRMRDDGLLTLHLTQKYNGKCILFVYSNQAKTTTDMYLFSVMETCEASMFASREQLLPGQNITLTMNGDPSGLVAIRALDDRLNNLQTRSSSSLRARYWDFSMFYRPNSTASAGFYNFINTLEIKKQLDEHCTIAAANFFMMFGKCPEPNLSASQISNYCLKIMIEKCLNPEAPSASPAENYRAGLFKTGRVFPVSKAGVFLRVSADEEPNLDVLSDVPGQEEDFGSDVRENFHEVWLFDTYKLRASGTASVSLRSPDSIGAWHISSAFYSPGNKDLCRPKSVTIIAKKEVFMNIDLPKHVYINETITAKISVTSLNVTREEKFSICITDISRKVCADLGAAGEHGRPAYTRVILSPDDPIDTKTFSLRFLATGPATVVFRLRKESSFPGKHHCDVGDILDQVKIKLDISKRADTEEHYKRFILNADKPLTKVMMSDSVTMEVPPKEFIEVSEYRSPTDSDAMVTLIRTNIEDTDKVYSFTVDLSKFLPASTGFESSRRSKRSTYDDYGNSFLSDVLKKISFELYQFKRIRMAEKPDPSRLEESEGRIGILISDMLRFSDCINGTTACGFGEFGKPGELEQRSVLLTALSTSVLCEASADERLVCGSILFLEEFLKKVKPGDNIDLHDMIDISDPEDIQWFINSFLMLVNRDCAAYTCKKNQDTWTRLILDYYNLDESQRFDDRTLAAISYMASNATTEIIRSKMLDKMNSDMLPFWSAGRMMNKSKGKLSSFEEASRFRRMKSGDILVNSLGILAFISIGAEGKALDWDPLANWIYEQQSADSTYDTPVDSYFAHRALFEYRFRKIDLQNDGNLQVTVSCPICEVRVVNVTETAQEIYLPTHIRNVTLTTKGHGKVKAGIRVLATKRQRSRRGLTQDDYYPVRITVDQNTIQDGVIQQSVCFKILSPTVHKVEVTHGLFTGYSSNPNKVAILENSTQIKLSNTPSVSSYATHFVLEGFQANVPLCYTIGIAEPTHNHEPIHLAPVAITARHPINDVVGMVLITHPDQNSAKRMKRSVSIMTPPYRITDKRKRYPRAIFDESIDTVCYEGGSCSCAETSCNVQCRQCGRDKDTAEFKTLIAEKGNFAVRVKVKSRNNTLVEGVSYLQLNTWIQDIKGHKEGDGAVLSDGSRIVFWLRECNNRCIESLQDESFDRLFILGNTEGLTVDQLGNINYVLRDMDRIEAAVTECQVFNSFITLNQR